MNDMQRPATPLKAAGQSAVRPEVLPQRLHHLAYVTQDTEATAAFYTEVLGLPLVNAVLDDHVPSTKEPLPYFHSFFRLGTGETIAFFECPGTPPPAPAPHPAYHNFAHVALEVPTRADVEAWHAWLSANGLDVISNDHGIIYSIYFRDPVNDIRLEITTTIDPEWNAREEAARAALDEWAATKRAARAAGQDVNAALRAVAAARSHSAEVAEPSRRLELRHVGCDVPASRPAPEWVHVQYSETAQFTEVYGFAGSQGAVNLEGVRLLPKGRPSQTLVVMMHPATSLQLLPVPRALAAAGVHVLCAGNRYLRNDTPLIMEKVALISPPISARRARAGATARSCCWAGRAAGRCRCSTSPRPSGRP